MNYKEKAYDEAIKQLRKHAPLIWQRCGFFWASQSALVIFYGDRTRSMQRDVVRGENEVFEDHFDLLKGKPGEVELAHIQRMRV